jgi:hypothetical protein
LVGLGSDVFFAFRCFLFPSVLLRFGFDSVFLTAGDLIMLLFDLSQSRSLEYAMEIFQPFVTSKIGFVLGQIL